VVVTHSATKELPYWTGPLSGVRPLQLALAGEGANALGRRLAEMCVIQVIRTHHATARIGAKPVEVSAVDPRITEAVRLINARPSTAWTVEGLARKVGMSRSVFSEAFDAAIGEAPIRYLTRVRMTIAAQMLRNQSAPLIEIAHQVGYSSDISLIRTFKRFFGVTPTEFRNHLAENEPRDVANFPLAHPAFVFEGPVPTR
jgi:transcriptional regulator GlxA family with amidase domain